MTTARCARRGSGSASPSHPSSPCSTSPRSCSPGPGHLLDGPLRDSVEQTLRDRLLARPEAELTVRIAHDSDDIVLRGAAVLVLWDQLGVA